MRQRGEDVFFLTGTDEHGEPVVQAAERLGVTPQELADRNAPRFLEMGERIEASNDFFIRTTDPRHVARVQEIVQRVHDNGHVYEGLYEGWYCPRCADFKTETERGPGNTCPIHEIVLERKREENWFFRLSAFEDDLRRLYAERSDFVLPRHRYNEALAFIEGGLEDVSLSPLGAELGRAAALASRAGDVRLVRRPAQLLHGALVRARGRGRDRSLLARDLAHHRQGHPQVPHRLLARLPARRRDRAARARLCARLPPDGREEDVEVARQRARPDRGGRALRRRRAALLLLPRGLLRPGRQRLGGGLRGSVRERARQRLGQPRQPHPGDDRALPRRASSPRARSTPSWPAATTGSEASTGSSASSSIAPS